MTINDFDILIKTFDIPEKRKHDWAWLSRNIGIRNADNPNLKIAKSFIDFMLRK